MPGASRAGRPEPRQELRETHEVGVAACQEERNSPGFGNCLIMRGVANEKDGLSPRGPEPVKRAPFISAFDLDEE